MARRESRGSILSASLDRGMISKFLGHMVPNDAM